MPVEPKRIWVVADDYGIARGVNAAIRDLLAQGAINAKLPRSRRCGRSQASPWDCISP